MQRIMIFYDREIRTDSKLQQRIDRTVQQAHPILDMFLHA